MFEWYWWVVIGVGLLLIGVIIWLLRVVCTWFYIGMSFLGAWFKAWDKTK